MNPLARPRNWITTLAVVGLLATPIAALAGHRFGGPGGGGHGGLEKQIERLDLDDATLTQVYGILDASRGETRTLRREMRSAHQAMRSLLEQDSPDQEKVMAQADALGALATQARKQQLKTMLQIRALLTPEQRDQLRQAMRSGHHRGHGRDKGRGGERF